MPKNENIFLTLQIEKDTQTKALALTIHFDKNSPNFSINDEEICWLPTPEEIDFIAEAFGILFHNKSYNTKWNEEGTSEKPLPNSTQKIEEPVYSPYEKKIAVAASTTADTTTDVESDYSSKQDDNAERIFVQADERTIDEALKRRKAGEEDYMANPNDRNVLDRVLKQKKKKESL